MENELKKRMISVIGSSSNPLIESIAERCVKVALEFCLETNPALTKSGVMPPLLSLDFKKMRKSKGLTLREVEEKTGVSNPYLSQLETGKIKSPGYDVVKVLYDLYSNEA